MEKTIIKFGDTEIKKSHQYKKPISMKNIDINKILVSFGEKGFKYFIGQKDAKRIRPSCIFRPKMS